MIIPRDRKIFAYGSRNNTYSDSSKSLFEMHTANKRKDEIVFWISSDTNLVNDLNKKGFLAFERWSLRGLFYSLSAKYFIYSFDIDDINFALSGGAKKINLWHGLPVKYIEFDTKVGDSSHIYNPSGIFQKISSYFFYYKKRVTIDLFSVPSLFWAEVFQRAFDNRIKKFNYGINPRLDKFARLSSGTQLNSIIDHSEIRSGQFNFTYMPTWRVGKSNFWNEALPDLQKLNEILAKKNAILKIKPHIYTQSICINFSNIIFIDKYEDPFEILLKTDCLITDYSSVCFDFALLKRNICFYHFDYDDYINSSSSDFYLEIRDLGGYLADDFNSLIEFIKTYDSSKSDYQLTKHCYDTVCGALQLTEFDIQVKILLDEIREL